MSKGIKDFQLPMRLELEKETASANYGRFSAEPFERGFGTTIGNSLRRVLLSSLPGAAVTSVKIEGAYHEFSTLPGVTEDLTIIILNIKRNLHPYNKTINTAVIVRWIKLVLFLKVYP